MVSAISLDLGTTAIKAGLLDHDGALHNIVSHPAPPLSVTDGRYESDALAYAEAAEQALGDCLSQTDEKPPIGLCSQRSSFLIWDRASGQPLIPLISWQDNRGIMSCEALRKEEALITQLTGLRLTPYYFAPKLRTVLLENPAWRERMERGDLLAGTLDTFLIWRWTGGKQYLTDASMAARTLLMDTRKQQWSPRLCELFEIPLNILPEIKPSAGLNLLLDNGLTLQASLGDQSAALIGSVGNSCAEALVNLGTGGFVIRQLPNINSSGGNLSGGYLRTLTYQDSRLQSHLAIEGTLNSIAAALATCPVSECRIEDLAKQDILCLVEPSGLGAPYFRSDLGLMFAHPVQQLSQREISALLLEGIIFRVARILEDFHREVAITRVYLSGGLSELTCLQQGIALCSPCDVYRLQQKDASLCGAATLAAGLEAACHGTKNKIQPLLDAGPLREKYGRWKNWLDGLLSPQTIH
jgi:glycerol kinase